MNAAIPGLGVWLINLPRSTERLEKMKAQLAALPLDYTLFQAVDGRARAEDLERDVDRLAFRRNMGREALPVKLAAIFRI